MLEEVVGISGVLSCKSAFAVDMKALDLDSNIPEPIRNLLKCSAVNQQAGGPPKPVAKPLEPSVASISTQKDPSTLIPKSVRELRYCG